MMKKGTITITLKSDLCVASGYSYAGIVDTEVCYDEYGIPYIPGRRLKGCFRETAENLLGCDDVDIAELFGKSAQENGGALCISNARIEDYDTIKSEIQELKTKYNGLFSSQRILGQFTRILSNTELYDGVAKDNSLRYTRVVNHYSSIKGSELVFKSEVLFRDNQNNQILEKIIKGTKNIGLKRNRGLGAVKCSLDNVMTIKNEDWFGINAQEKTSNANNDHLKNECVINFTIINDEPLVLNSMNGGHSVKYISGQMILGALVAKYLSKGGGEESAEFKDLFLNGTTKFVNAYPSENGIIYYPAPMNINILKKSKRIINSFLPFSPDEPGDKPKKIKGKYTFISGDEIRIKDVDMKLRYHHRRERKNDNGIIEEKLYPIEAVEADQEFTGQIYTQERYKNIFVKLLRNGTLSFGQSKNAEYGTCRCTDCSSIKMSSVEVEKGKTILVTFLTDTIIYDENKGSYTVDTNEAECQILDVLKSKSEKDKTSIKSKHESIIETSLVSGYQTKWNLNKPLIPVIKAGSVFTFEAEEKMSFPEKIWVGIKNQEGFGVAQISILKTSQLNKTEQEKMIADSECVSARPIIETIAKQQLLSILVTEKNIDLKPDITKTQIARASLMLRQSLEFTPDSQEQFQNFCDRISSIKKDNVRSDFEEKLINPLKNNDKLNFKQILDENADEKVKKDFEIIKEILCDVDINILWGDYMKLQLTKCKFKAKED